MPKHGSGPKPDLFDLYIIDLFLEGAVACLVVGGYPNFGKHWMWAGIF